MSDCTDIVSCKKANTQEEEDQPNELPSLADLGTEQQQEHADTDSSATAAPDTEDISDSGSNDGQYSCALDHLGPIILNADGTMGRISNWTTMMQPEKDMALRLIAARNKRRKEANNRKLFDGIKL